jgi:archaellum component FlaC
VPLLTPLDADQRATFLVVSLTQKALGKLVGRLGTAPSGTRLDTLNAWDLAWSLVDYYEEDHEVAAAVDQVLRRELGDSPLASAAGVDGAAPALAGLLLESRDPVRDLAWALLRAEAEAARSTAPSLVQAIIADYDAAEAAAEAEEKEDAAAAEAPEDTEEAGASAGRIPTDIVKEAARAKSQRERALKRLGTVKERVTDLEQRLAGARRELRASETARRRLATERDRLAEEAKTLRGRLQSGTAGEVTRLEEALEAEKRQVRALESELEETREAETAAAARLRALETQRPSRPAGDDEEERGPSEGVGWSLPILTDEFYESIRGWDRKVVRTAFERIHRLAEDWRHPSLRAIPLEGIPGYYRIRVATDVRLIYRPVDGGRLEILSLIDREDLQRYVRQAKTR